MDWAKWKRRAQCVHLSILLFLFLLALAGVAYGLFGDHPPTTPSGQVVIKK